MLDPAYELAYGQGRIKQRWNPPDLDVRAALLRATSML